ncbi:MAG: ribosome silencing factor [Synergistaceae bacterium]|jgi:ribosome-associated protein|nr:ribosome silencing factor [Synergistaceae bacterium]
MAIEANIYEEYMPIIDALKSKRATDIDFIDLKGISGFADAFIVATARSEINARTLVDAATDAMDGMGMPYKIEGETSLRWRLIDAGHIVIHIFSREGRDFYRLERLWGDAPSKRFEDEDD